MTDELKQQVLKRDGGCINCLHLLGSPTTRLSPGRSGHDGGGFDSSESRCTFPSPEPNGLHFHHEYGTYQDEYWPRQDVKEKTVMLCPSCHAKRTQGDHFTIQRNIRRYLKNRYPDYNFGKRFNPMTGSYDIPIGGV